QQARHDDDDPLRSGEDPHIAGETEALRAGPNVAHQEVTGQSDQEDDRLQAVVVSQEVDQDSQVDDTFRIAVDGRVEEGAVAVDLAGGPGERTTKDVEEAGDGEDEAAEQQLVDGDEKGSGTRDDQTEERQH